MVKADKGIKFDRDKINEILVLIKFDMSDEELGVLINKLRQEQVRRNQESQCKNMDTIQT